MDAPAGAIAIRLVRSRRGGAGDHHHHRTRESGDDFCVVTFGDENAVVGLLRGDALLKDRDARADEVMELGPKTTRPSEPLDELLRSNEAVGVKHFLIATSHGSLLGVLDRNTADRAVAERRADGTRASD